MTVQLNKDFTIDYSVKLGEGAFGMVFRGIWKSKNTFVAIKKIKDGLIGKEDMAKEISTMEAINHENILNLIGIVESNQGTFIIIEYCEGGSLDKEIKKGIPELDCFLFLKMIVDGMYAVNEKDHIHRDIKPENILFTKQKILKVCDFGLARKILGDDPNKIQRFSAKGTPLFSAPQILRHQKYSGKCDVWSTGVVLVEMLTKINPFAKAKNLVTLMSFQQKIRQDTGYYILEGNYNPWFAEIIAHMIEYDDQKRWSFKQLKQKIQKDYKSMIKYYGKFTGIQTTDVEYNPTKGQEVSTLNNYKIPGADRLDIKNLHHKNIKIVETVPNDANISKQQKKLVTREQNKKLLIAFKAYVQFIYNRGKLFADTATKFYQAQENTKANGFKFMILFLGIAVFLKSIQKILKMFDETTSVILLPDGVKIILEQLDEVSKNEFDSTKKEYQNEMPKEAKKFQDTINLIDLKMHSDKYKNEYRALYNRQQDILDEITNMNQRKSKKTFEDFEEVFRSFFREECLENRLNNLHEGYLRIHWICLNLAYVKSKLPLDRYRENYIINQLIDDSTKLPIPKVKTDIEELQKNLI